jgi:hypothetical protein
MEAVWTFVHISDDPDESDLYLILNASDGKGFRCLGFQKPNAPYPQMLGWVSSDVTSATGRCTRAGVSQPVFTAAYCNDRTITDQTSCTGSYDYCNDSSITAQAQCTGMYDANNDVDSQNSDGLETARAWTTGGTRSWVAATCTGGDPHDSSTSSYTTEATCKLHQTECTLDSDCSAGNGAAYCTNNSDGSANTTSGQSEEANCKTVVVLSAAGTFSRGDIVKQGTNVMGYITNSVTQSTSIEVTMTLNTSEVATAFTASATGTIGETSVTFSSITSERTYHAVETCEKETVIAGEWSPSARGVQNNQLKRCAKDRDGNSVPPCTLHYFCGFEDNVQGSAKAQLLADGGAVWNVKPLGCDVDDERRWYCTEERRYDNQFVIRSLATGDQNRDGVVDVNDYDCIYFPARGTAAGIPRRTPKEPTDDGLWLGVGASADADGNGDPECGISLFVDSEEDNLSQEHALVVDKSAVFSLIPLPDY